MANGEQDYQSYSETRIPEWANQVGPNSYIGTNDKGESFEFIVDQPEANQHHPSQALQEYMPSSAPARLRIDLEAPAEDLIYIAQRMGFNGAPQQSYTSPLEEMLIARALAAASTQSAGAIEAPVLPAIDAAPQSDIDILQGKLDEVDEKNEPATPKKRMGKRALVGLFLASGVTTAALLQFTIAPALKESAENLADKSRAECGLILNAACYFEEIVKEYNVGNILNSLNSSGKSEGSDE